MDTKLSPRDHAPEECLSLVLFMMTCACGIKQTLFLLKYLIHQFCYYKNFVKAMFPVPVKHGIKQWNKFVLDR